MIRRPAFGFENYYAITRSFNQLAFGLAKPANRDRVIDLIEQRVLGLRLKYSIPDNYLVYEDRKAEIMDIPKTIKTARDACFWMSKQVPDITKNLAVIAANDNVVCLNTNHLTGDGTFLHNLHDAITRNEDANTVRGFPMAPELHFMNELVTDRREMEDDEFVPAANSRMSFESSTKARVLESIIDEVDVNCYDQRKKGLSKLTEALWIASGVAASIFNGRQSNFGALTCFDLRRARKGEPLDWNVTDHIVDLPVYARARPDSLVRDVMAQCRKDFVQKVREGAPIRHLKALMNPKQLLEEDDADAAWFEVSSAGAFRPSNLIDDVHMLGTSEQLAARGLTCILAYSVETPAKKKLVLQQTTADFDLVPRDSERLFELVKASLRTVTPEMTVAEAIAAVERAVK